MFLVHKPSFNILIHFPFLIKLQNNSKNDTKQEVSNTISGFFLILYYYIPIIYR